MKIALLSLLILLPQICSANVYMHIDSNGNVTYSDVPTESNAAKIEVPKTSTAPAASITQPLKQTESTTLTTPGKQTANVDLTNIRKPYTKFIIETPANGDTIQNQPVLEVSVNIEPKLQTGDVIQIYMDGNPWGKPLGSTQFILPIPERGTHEIAAKVFDKDKKNLISTDSYTIYVKQAHLGSQG